MLLRSPWVLPPPSAAAPPCAQIGLGRRQRAAVRDLYGGRDLGVFEGSFSAAVPVHDVAVLRITPVEGPRDDAWRPWHGQPIYAPQPANLAVPSAAAWIEGYVGAGAGAAVPKQQQPPQQQQGGTKAAGQQQKQQQMQQQRAADAAQPSGFVLTPGVLVGLVAAVAAVGAAGYFVLLQMRLRGWTALRGSDDRKAAELAEAANPHWRNHLGVSNVPVPVSTPAARPV